MLLILVFIASLSYGATAKHPDEVDSLPGLNFSLNYRHYSGYLNASCGKFLYYWFVESQTSPSTDPVVLWLNGGPGCSSLMGFLDELGPLRVAPDGKTLTNNTFSWNKEANFIFLEAPAGVGFSYSLNKTYDTDDDTTSHDNFVALQSFFKKFPQFKKNDFYITGESYAGIYIPTLSLRILTGSSNINFKKFDISYIVHGIGLNAYNLYQDCAQSSENNSRYLVDKRNILSFFPKSDKLNNLKEDPSCTDSSALRKYLNQPAVRKALHIPSTVQDWDVCSSDVGKGYKKIYNTMRPQMKQLIKSGKLRGLIYNGDVDMVCNFLGDEWFSDSLGFKVIEDYKEWKYDDQVAGFVKYYDGLTFLTIKGSGHMVPTDKPGPAFKMISSFLKNQRL